MPTGATQSRLILAARTARLAARRDAAAKPAEQRQDVLACAVGAEVYGIALEAVAEVLPERPCTPVIGAGPPVLGAIGLAGRMFSVVDLAASLGLPGNAQDGSAPGKGHLLRLDRASRRILLRVDRAFTVVSVVPAAQQDHEPRPGMGGRAVSGYAHAPTGSIAARETLLGLLDLDELLRPLLALAPGA